jgi:hypothetical protein
MINTLNDTVPLMNSEDYKERFIGEYYQTKIRYERLKAFNTRITASAECLTVPEPAHDCPIHILRRQQKIMGEYLHILELRAVMENINLEEYKCN